MKLYLSSFRIGNLAQELVKMWPANSKMAVIVNALDEITDPKLRKTKVDFEISSLDELGITSEEVDLRRFFGKPNELSDELKDYAGVWVRGGNTFILRRAFAYSGFDKWIINKSKDPDFVYGGYSAGVCVLSPDLHGLELVDPTDITPEGYQPEIIWEGLNLIDFRFAPHYRSDHPESARVEEEVAHYEKLGLKYRALRDGEVIISETLKP